MSVDGRTSRTHLLRGDPARRESNRQGLRDVCRAVPGGHRDATAAARVNRAVGEAKGRGWKNVHMWHISLTRGKHEERYLIPAA